MPEAPRPLPPKKEVALALLEGPSVFVHLDPRREGVLVPKGLAGSAQLVLQIGLDMANPIPDLHVDDAGITCTLSFSRTPFWCRLPWSAVYALIGEDRRGMIWPDDVPAEVAVQMMAQEGAPAPKPAKKPRRSTGGARVRQRPVIVADEPREEAPLSPVRALAPVVSPAGEAKQATARPGAARKPRRELPPYLRVVK